MALQNNGYENWKVLQQYLPYDGSPTGKIMPNIAQISPQAIITTANTITFNADADVAPTGGINSDVWYNKPGDALYKKIAGTWTLLTDRVTNDFYVADVINTTDCPLPA